MISEEFIIEMIEIDGSYGEGGGQILRFAAALGAATGSRIKVYNIRSKRPNPGLRPQHLAVLKIMKSIFGGELLNAHIGSKEVIFEFNKPSRGVVFKYDVGTAGSISLIIQSLVPALILAEEPSRIELIGGTDVKWSPTIDYMKYVYANLVKLIGGRIEIEIIKRGYYPKGGGIVILYVEPAEKLNKLSYLERGLISDIEIRIVLSHLPRHIAEREINNLRESFSRFNRIDHANLSYKTSILTSYKDAAGPGNSIIILCKQDNGIVSGFDSIGEKGKPAETVAEEAFIKFEKWYLSNGVFDINAGDMLIPLIALAGGGEYTVPEYTLHMESALYVMKLILNRDYKVYEMSKAVKISIY